MYLLTHNLGLNIMQNYNITAGDALKMYLVKMKKSNKYIQIIFSDIKNKPVLESDKEKIVSVLNT